MNLLLILILISGVSFLYYGITTLRASSKTEFDRYRLGKFRKLTGYLQLCGGIGLLVGIECPLILSVSSGGLSLLMLMGFMVRVKIRDGFLLSMPSFLFMILNTYIFIESIK